MVKDDRVCSAARRDSNKLLACGLRDARQRIYGHFLIKQMEIFKQYHFVLMLCVFHSAETRCFAKIMQW